MCNYVLGTLSYFSVIGISVFHAACFALGPGLAIRVICAEEPYACKDFAETNNILKIVADYSASVKKVCILYSFHLLSNKVLAYLFSFILRF